MDTGSVAMRLDRQILDGLASQLRRLSYWGQHDAWAKHEKYIAELHGVIFHLVDEVKKLQEKVVELESKTAHLPSHVDVETYGQEQASSIRGSRIQDPIDL